MLYPIDDPYLLPTDPRDGRLILTLAVSDGAYPDEERSCLHDFELNSSEVFRKAQEMNNDGRNICAEDNEHDWIL